GVDDFGALGVQLRDEGLEPPFVACLIGAFRYRKVDRVRIPTDVDVALAVDGWMLVPQLVAGPPQVRGVLDLGIDDEGARTVKGSNPEAKSVPRQRISP